ncbi:hypothetical protein C8Q79DRAFT_457074 [Trametes meyenii]|nr:hypothetical protein C8Q79DRAFT_457074 [Trametes meyenii]
MSANGSILILGPTGNVIPGPSSLGSFPQQMRRDSALAVNVTFSVATRTAIPFPLELRTTGTGLSRLVGEQRPGPPIPPNSLACAAFDSKGQARTHPSFNVVCGYACKHRSSFPSRKRLHSRSPLSSSLSPRTISGLPSAQQYRMSIVR